MEGSDVICGSPMRIRVGLNVNKPLRRVLKLRTALGDELLISFTYERFPNFCYLCGRLNHLSKSCDKQLKADFIDPRKDTPFGPWLKANNPNNIRPRIQGFSGPSATSVRGRPFFIHPSQRHNEALGQPPVRGTNIFDCFNEHPPTPYHIPQSADINDRPIVELPRDRGALDNMVQSRGIGDNIGGYCSTSVAAYRDIIGRYEVNVLYNA
ncbi:UNVERIFIED_CONTAM: hypothetical protein Slati_2479500 [Sesamum latifolium]|uniref:CCHC-type domain-containing protein n=1 Tax=Sesamum latifolium TaxID=2727402 RepID=A0AAW2WIE5_9LAMI